MKPIETDTLIIGSGFYGTGLANYLYCQKKNFIVTGNYMDLWLNHTLNTMLLRSEIKTSALAHPDNRFSLENFSRENNINLPSRIPVLLFREYLIWCRKQFNYKIKGPPFKAKKNTTFRIVCNTGYRLNIISISFLFINTITGLPWGQRDGSLHLTSSLKSSSIEAREISSPFFTAPLHAIDFAI